MSTYSAIPEGSGAAAALQRVREASARASELRAEAQQRRASGDAAGATAALAQANAILSQSQQENTGGVFSRIPPEAAVLGLGFAGLLLLRATRKR